MRSTILASSGGAGGAFVAPSLDRDAEAAAAEAKQAQAAAAAQAERKAAEAKTAAELAKAAQASGGLPKNLRAPPSSPHPTCRGVVLLPCG